jgi:kinesin family protein 3/17
VPRELSSGALYQSAVLVEAGGQAVTVSENIGEALGASAALYNTHRFTFDRVFGEDADQSEVYGTSARHAVLSTLQGYNATILAYGQTGTGKTFSMEGYQGDQLRGIIPRAVDDIFSYIQNKANENARFLVRASYLQIYNDSISDLLRPDRTNLQIREDKKKGVFVEGLSEWIARSPREVFALMRRGSALRATSATRINEVSSRSHALFIIIVEQNERVAEEDADTSEGPPAPWPPEPEGPRTRQSFKVAKLNLVDLAGSERVRQSGAQGQRLEESKRINKSLSALGNVIAALTDRTGRAHIPYRDSKLTRILEDSLGGNCRTTMLATISPALEAFQETLSTLKFANRAKNIQNAPRINEDVDEKALLRRYERELKQLRASLESRSQNVVDKSRLIEVEEQRRRAEQDKQHALQNVEVLARELQQEKIEKQKLERRIREMSSQLLVGGHDAVHESEQFKAALRAEQERIRGEYELRLAELERERATISVEKNQTERYKQLLLKQRDIMIQLTARLNERDQSILALTEELDSYDRQHRFMESQLDRKTASLIRLQTADPSSPPQSPLQRSPLATAALPAHFAPAQRAVFFAAPVLARASSSSAPGTPSLPLESAAEERPRTAGPLQSREREGSGSVMSPRSPSRDEAGEAPEAAELAASAPGDASEVAVELAGERMQSLLRVVAEKSEESERLQEQIQQLQGEKMTLEQMYREQQGRYQQQCKERSALQIIMENKVKALVDTIATALLDDAQSSVSVPSRTRKQVDVLKRLVDAAVVAMKNSPAAPGSSSQSVQPEQSTQAQPLPSAPQPH